MNMRNQWKYKNIRIILIDYYIVTSTSFISVISPKMDNQSKFLKINIGENNDINICINPGVSEIEKSLADFLRENFNEKSKKYYFAFPGGSAVNVLAKAIKLSGISTKNLIIFMGDERYVNLEGILLNK